MIIHGETISAEAYLGEYPIYVTYGGMAGGHVEGVTERIGHFIEPSEEYPESEERLREVLESIVF